MMSTITFEAVADSLYMSQEVQNESSKDIFIRSAEVPAHLWQEVLAYDKKLKDLMVQLKEYSV